MITRPSLSHAGRSHQTDVDVFRRILENQLREREALLGELVPRAAPHLDVVAWTMSQSSKRVIAQITQALERIAMGTFGICAGCSEPIATDRLAVVPHAELCVTCQGLAEQ
ncbi:TraR/DksA C4-type zinc finger protein [Cryobacterium sp. N19]|uniref:TraR/DksA family transcriptional regulator n=1 Tax=Cryobacterium sp. N19 TaxID=2048288 RepID=UPI000CE2E73A